MTHEKKIEYNKWSKEALIMEIDKCRENTIDEVLNKIDYIYGTTIVLKDGTYIQDDRLLVRSAVIDAITRLKEQK